MQYDRNGALLRSDIPGLPAPKRGKVRDIYQVGDALLLVATDRISAFDVVMPNGIPDKGRVLTAMSRFWFDLLKWMPNHLISMDVAAYPAVLQPYAKDLAGRSMLVRRAEVVPVECVARGYLIGTGWKDYQKSGAVCGIPLRAGYQIASKLESPLFTPSTKAEQGEHDANITYAQVIDLVGAETAAKLREATLKLYSAAADFAATKGLIIADTKFEFGYFEGQLILVDEVLTCDSSRFWPAAQYQVGANPPSLDKQFVRDYLEAIKWPKQPPAPDLPDDIVMKTREKYLQAYRELTGLAL